MIDLAAAIRERQLSPVDVTNHYLRRTEELNAQVGAFYTVTAELAQDQARAAEKAVTERSESGAAPPLLGVPIPIKDLNMVDGVRLTFGSAVYEAYVAAGDDYVVAAIRSAGAVITGKTGTPEFGLSCYTETAIGPPARTPWDLTRSAGGSSGGAAAAVASRLAPAAQGSDGGGSIRIPSSVCGLFGIKPSRGRVSEWPIVPDLFGLAVNGPIARTVADAALLLDVMSCNYPGDMYTLPPLPEGETFLGGELIFAQAYLQAVLRPALAAMNAYDAILTPTVASPPVPVGYFTEVGPAENFERQKRFTPFTAAYNLSGQPAVNLPLHWNAEGLPIGVMLAGRIGEEGTLISLSAQIEEAHPWRDRVLPAI